MGVHNEARESLPQVVPNISVSTSQVNPHHIIPPTPNIVPSRGEEVDLHEIEDAIALMRESRSEIAVLKHIKVVVFKKRFEKKTHSFVHQIYPKAQ